MAELPTVQLLFLCLQDQILNHRLKVCALSLSSHEIDIKRIKNKTKITIVIQAPAGVIVLSSPFEVVYSVVEFVPSEVVELSSLAST